MLRASRRLSLLLSSATKRNSRSRRLTRRLEVEPLEGRALLSGVSTSAVSNFLPLLTISQGSGGVPSSSPTGFSPSTIRSAYGVNLVTFGSVTGDGTGQTIAIVDAYSEPTITSDLTAFDNQFGIAAPPSFSIVGETGAPLPGPDPNPTDHAGIEEALDVEWAHAMAPKANLVLVEAQSFQPIDLFTAVSEARSYPGVSVVSMSFGGPESSVDTTYEPVFTTPVGHTGVTFVAASGDSGAYVPNSSTIAVNFPASSPNVLSVGATNLTLNANGSYSSESGWGSGTSSGYNGGSGGGYSQIFSQPSYQNGVVPGTSQREVPDVSIVGDPATGVPVYDATDNGASTPWLEVGGTSLSAPLWSGIIAIANQGRALAGLTSLDGPSETLPKIYSMTSSDFHDVTTGSNGYSAGPGYDLVTGRGTPVVNLVVQGLIGSDDNGTILQNRILTANQSITSPNGVYSLTMQGDGNLVETGIGGQVLWDSGTTGVGNYVWMQSDGNLVVYSSSQAALWSSGTSGNSNAYLSLEDNGTTEIYQNGTNAFLWTGNTVALDNRTLYQRQSIYSANGQYQLIMQTDGNLVEYGPGNSVIFASNTAGHPGAYAWMQTDGNLVVYSGNTVLWASGSSGFSNSQLTVSNSGFLGIYQAPSSTLIWTGNYDLYDDRILTAYQAIFATEKVFSTNIVEYYLEMRPDGNLVEYDMSGNILFASRTSGNPGAYAWMQIDGNLVVYSSTGQPLWSSDTGSTGAAYLMIQGNSALSLTSADDGQVLWTPETLDSGRELQPNEALYSAGGTYYMVMQGDGNLVVYTSAGQVVSDSGTSGYPGAYLDMQANGDLVIYYGTEAIWSSGTTNDPGAYVGLDTKGELILYVNGQAKSLNLL